MNLQARVCLDRLIAQTRALVDEHEMMIARGLPGYSVRKSLSNSVASVYARASHRYLGKSTAIPTVEVASITVREKFQRQGICKGYLAAIELIAQETGRYVVVECVLNKDLDRHLRDERKGYVPLVGVVGVDTFYHDPNGSTGATNEHP